MSEASITDPIDEAYEELTNGEAVEYDVASMYHAENHGFFRSNGEGRAIGAHLVEGGIYFGIYRVYRDDDPTKVAEIEGLTLAVDDLTQHTMELLLKEANRMEKEESGVSSADEKLGYIG
jgi:hypothetical protein